MAIRWDSYNVENLHDELIKKAGLPRPFAKDLCEYLATLSDVDIKEFKTASDLSIQTMGITFTVYNEEEGSIDRAWPLI